MTNLVWYKREPTEQNGGTERVNENNGLPVELFWRADDTLEAERVASAHELPVRDPSLQDLMALVRQPIRYASSVTITCAAAGDYAAGDVWSATASNNAGLPTYVPSLARSKGQPAVIVAIRAVSSNASLLNRLRLHFFKYAPAAADAEMDDNAVFSLTTNQARAWWSGSVLTAPFTTKGVSDTSALQDPLLTAPNDDGLYLVLTTEDAEVNEAANQTVRLDFYTL